MLLVEEGVVLEPLEVPEHERVHRVERLGHDDDRVRCDHEHDERQLPARLTQKIRLLGDPNGAVEGEHPRHLVT